MRIIFEDDEGGLNVIEPSEWALANGWTIEEIAAVDVPKGKSFEIIEDSQIPSDRTFRPAWKATGKWIDVNMEKARVIHMDRIRVRRNKKLADLDLEIKIAEDSGKDAKSLKDQRQPLRDIPKTFDLEKYPTADQLKNAWPEQLKDYK